MGPTGPRWAPCWLHEPCYLGYWLNMKVSVLKLAVEYSHKTLKWYSIYWNTSRCIPYRWLVNSLIYFLIDLFHQLIHIYLLITYNSFTYSFIEKKWHHTEKLNFIQLFNTDWRIIFSRNHLPFPETWSYARHVIIGLPLQSYDGNRNRR